jgi:nucleoside-triphosphatase THEP1
MHIAYTMASGRGETDRLLSRCVDRLKARGLRVCGTVQINTGPAGCNPCDMDVRILPDGALLRISQNLGRFGRGCRLDPSALEEAVGLTQQELAKGADIMIVNKFGKQESAGRGFRNVIAEAVAQGVPVIVGLSALNRDAFLLFTDGQAEEIAADTDILEAWAMARICPTDTTVGA